MDVWNVKEDAFGVGRSGLIGTAVLRTRKRGAGSECSPNGIPNSSLCWLGYPMVNTPYLMAWLNYDMLM